MPWERVADDWVEEFEGRGVEFDIVPPALRPILVERGVEILPPHKGMGKDCVKAYEEWVAGNTDKNLRFSIIGDNQKDTKFDMQGNAINDEVKLLVEKVDSVKEITDNDFIRPGRSIRLPDLPNKVAMAIGSGKPVIIKKNIFVRNSNSHKDLTPSQSREILHEALYNTRSYGQSQPASRPYNWIVINLSKDKEENRAVVVETNPGKEDTEIIHWHFLRGKALETLKRQAIREGGHILMLPSIEEEAGGLSSLTNGLSSAGKFSNNSGTVQENSEKLALVSPEDDAKYLEAVEKNDTESAAKMVTEAVKKAMAMGAIRKSEIYPHSIGSGNWGVVTTSLRYRSGTGSPQRAAKASVAYGVPPL